ncbi:MAG TPA: tripartite tricarboxylate transporter substrate-binding protein [Burkholderiales bacterium]|nr:tripartite tricarboxylate transporter substrate-binding protein [Burkholderiales bacterium]
MLQTASFHMPTPALRFRDALKATCIAALCAAHVILATPVSAQRYPNKPIRVVVAFGPGGIADTVARLIGQKLADGYGQQVVVDNRPGAGGTLGAKLVAGASPDGYTLLVITAAVAVNASAAREAVDPRSELTAVALTASTPTIFAVHRSVTAKSLMDYLRGAKNGRFTYSTAGVGTTEHLTSEYLFRAVSGFDATHVPYQGGAAPVTAVAGQQVDLTTTTVPTAFPLIKQGSLRVMAVASHKRIAVLPEVPTLAESGFPDFENASWIAYFAPAKTPAAIAQGLNAEINKALRQADVRERLTALGFDAQASTRAEFADYVKSEVAKWAKVVKTTGITLN